jgi:hypothetical protein
MKHKAEKQCPNVQYKTKSVGKRKVKRKVNYTSDYEMSISET